MALAATTFWTCAKKKYVYFLADVINNKDVDLKGIAASRVTKRSAAIPIA